MMSRTIPLAAAATLMLALASPAAFAQAASSPAAKPVTQSSQASRPASGRPANLRAEPVPPQVDKTFERWDTDHDKALSQQEFRNGWRDMRRAVQVREGLQHQFSSVDANGNKAIDANEYGHLLLIQQAGKAAPPLSAYDANKNQRLEFTEYLDLVRRMSERRTTSPGRPGKTPAR